MLYPSINEIKKNKNSNESTGEIAPNLKNEL